MASKWQSLHLWGPFPRGAAIYAFYDKAGHPLYIGKTRDLCGRMSEHRREATVPPMLIQYIKARPCRTAHEMASLEVRLIRRLAPPYNTLDKDEVLPMGAGHANARRRTTRAQLNLKLSAETIFRLKRICEERGLTQKAAIELGIDLLISRERLASDEPY